MTKSCQSTRRTRSAGRRAGFQDLGTLAIGGTFGASWADAAGYLYVSVNVSGDMCRIAPTTNQAIHLRHGKPAFASGSIRPARGTRLGVRATEGGGEGGACLRREIADFGERPLEVTISD